MSSLLIAPSPRIPLPVTWRMLSYCECSALNLFSATSKSACRLRESEEFEQLERVIFSTIRIFDRKCWKSCYHTEITDQFDPDRIQKRVMRAFLSAYYGPDPLGRRGRAHEYSLTPSVVPREIVRNKQEQYCLYILADSAGHAFRGHQAKFSRYDSAALKQYGGVPASSERLVLQLRGLFHYGTLWSKEPQKAEEQGQVQFLNNLRKKTGWGELPDALAQNTVVINHHTLTAERGLSYNKSGIEGYAHPVYGRTIEQVQQKDESYNMVSGGFRRTGYHRERGLKTAVLEIRGDNTWSNMIGVVVMRSF